MATLQINTTLDTEEYENAGNGYEPIPESDYEAFVYEADIVKVKQGKYEGSPRLALTFKLEEGQVAPDGSKVGGRQLWKTVNAFEVWSDKKQKFFPPFELLEFGKAAGYTTAEILGGLDTDDLLGKKVQIRVVQVPRRVKEGDNYVDHPTDKSNDITAFKSLSAPASTGRAASAAPAKAKGGKATAAGGFKL